MFYLKLEDINERCRIDAAEFVGECEQRYNNVIESIAERICAGRKESPILMLNGPSSSGKTTTARRIREAVERLGVPSHTISMDDYYLSRGTYVVPKDENGMDDLESPDCMDLPLLSEHLMALAEGKTIEVPRFDFMTRSRMQERDEVSLANGEIAVIEGIHALNDIITDKLDGKAMGIYMAVGTEVVIENEWRLAPHVLRFVRRAIRDNNFRDSPISQTIDMWASVRRGERLYIRPHIPAASYIVDTYLPYEDCILINQLRELAQPYLQEMTAENLGELVRALPLFEEISDLSLIPAASIMHEFIG